MKSKNDVTVYLSEGEYQQVKEAAKEAGMSVSAYMRALVNRSYLRPGMPVQIYQAMENMRKIGNNLNQIAAVANSTHDVNADLYTREARKLEEKITEWEQRVFLPEESQEG